MKRSSALLLRLAIAACCAVAAGLPGPAFADPLPSGSAFISESLRVQQQDDAANPGMLWVAEGEELWKTPAGAAGKSCADCHGAAAESMRGAATRYPVHDPEAETLLNVEGRINRCRTEHQRAEPLDYESDPLLALTAFVARQSLGMPMNVDIGGPAASYYSDGEASFHRRQGQLNLSCAQCHDDHPGKRLRGDTISYGLGTGYPVYRLEWQSLGSLHRRLRACSLGVRAVQFPYGSRQYLSLELYLAKRAQGVPIETPAMRR